MVIITQTASIVIYGTSDCAGWTEQVCNDQYDDDGDGDIDCADPTVLVMLLSKWSNRGRLYQRFG